jgi:hypothetical protein
VNAIRAWEAPGLLLSKTLAGTGVVKSRRRCQPKTKQLNSSVTAPKELVLDIFFRVSRNADFQQVFFYCRADPAADTSKLPNVPGASEGSCPRGLSRFISS